MKLFHANSVKCTLQIDFDIKGHLPEAEVLAYGSRVTGTAHEGSDLDLVARNPLNRQQPFQDLGEVREAFSESNLPILVDILDWAQIPESFREEIERSGIEIFTLVNKLQLGNALSRQAPVCE